MSLTARLVVLVVGGLAALGSADSAHAAATKPKFCGSLGTAYNVGPAYALVNAGSVPCKTARKVLRAYGRSDAPCAGSACLRNHYGWSCIAAKSFDFPRLATCSRGARRVTANLPAD